MKICLAGTGAMGEIHVKALAKIEGVEVVSVAGRTDGGVKEFADEVEYPVLIPTDLEACIDRPGVDAVILTTPSDQHCDQTLLALSQGQARPGRDPDGAEPGRLAAHAGRRQEGRKGAAWSRTRAASRARTAKSAVASRRGHSTCTTWWSRPISSAGPISTCTASRARGSTTCSWHHGCHSVDLAHWVLDEPNWDVWGQKGPDHPELGIPMDLTVAMKSKKGPLFTMAMSFNNKGPFGGFYRYIGEEETYKVYRDSMTDSEGNDVQLDDVPAFDRQDVEFVGAIREGREPESSAASVVPTMALLTRSTRPE